MTFGMIFFLVIMHSNLVPYDIVTWHIKEDCADWDMAVLYHCILFRGNNQQQSFLGQFRESGWWLDSACRKEPVKRREKYQLSCYWSKEWDRCFTQGESSYLALEMHEKGSRNGIITTSHKDQRSSHRSTEAIKLELLLDFIFEGVTK